MPTYVYTTKAGVTVERHFPRGEAPESVRVKGKIARRDFRAEHVKVPATTGWPMEPCVGSGVNAADAGKLRKFFKDRNCPTEVTRDGDPVYRSKAHRDRALKLRGLHDKNSY